MRMILSETRKNNDAIATITNTMAVVIMVSLREGQVTLRVSSRTSCRNLNGDVSIAALQSNLSSKGLPISAGCRVKPISLNSRKFNALTPVLVARPNSRSNFNTSHFCDLGTKVGQSKIAPPPLKNWRHRRDAKHFKVEGGVPPNCTARKQLQGLPPLLNRPQLRAFWISGGRAFSKRLKRSPFSTWAKELQPRPHSLKVRCLPAT